ncbi:MAG TPA: hypothetical protein VKB76_02920, partial [Ktedonobacterales bacterium]|nr:hypothetical protein [Ktedonobacterales bacterium]
MRSIPPGAQAEPEGRTARSGASLWTRWALIYLALSIMEVLPPLLLVLLALGKVQQVGDVDPLGTLALVLATFALFVAGHSIAATSARSRLMWRLGQPLFGVVAVAIVALLAVSAPPAITLIDIPPALLDATIIVWVGLRARSFLRYQQAGADAAQDWVLQTVRVGLIAFVAALVLAIIFDVPQALSGVVLLPAYLLGGIVASAVLRSVMLQQVATQDDQPSEQHPWTWVAGGIGVLCTLAFFGGGLLGTQLFAGVVTPVFQALATGAQWLRNGIVWLFTSLVSLFNGLFSPGSTSTRSTTSTSTPPPQHSSAPAGFPTWAVALSALLWVMFIVWLIVSWWRSRRPPTARRQIRIPRWLVITILAILLLILLAPLLLSASTSTS